jgi:hypothetical protein
VVAKFNRIQVGAEALTGSQVPQTAQSWVADWVADAMPFASIAVTSQIGGNAIVSAARTSDFRSWSGTQSGGAAGIYGFGLNDDTVSATPIACGVCGIAMRAAGVTGLTLNQFDISNFGSVVDATPASGVVGGTTWGIGITAGAYHNTLNNSTGALYIGNGQNAKFRKGIIVFSGTNGGLDTSVGAGGAGVAMEMGSGQTLRWLNSSNTTVAEVWGSAGGLNIPQGIVGATDGGAGAAGVVGQYLNHSTSGTAMTTATNVNCDSISLPPGEYDVTGSIQFNPAGTTTVSGINAGISLSSGALPSFPLLNTLSAALTTGGVQAMAAPLVRVSPTVTTTVFLVGRAGFGTSTMTCDGAIRARRVR